MKPDTDQPPMSKSVLKRLQEQGAEPVATKAVQTCVECGHNNVDREGRCRFEILHPKHLQGNYPVRYCGCKCVFPVPEGGGEPEPIGCPFCPERHATMVIDRGESYPSYSVSCCGCRTVGPAVATRERAVERWNTRPYFRPAGGINDEADTSELLPCPFCGSAVSLGCGYTWKIHCPRCGTIQSPKAGLGDKNLSAWWNARVSQPAGEPSDSDEHCSHWREGDSDTCPLCGTDLGPTTIEDVRTDAAQPLPTTQFIPRYGTPCTLAEHTHPTTDARDWLRYAQSELECHAEWWRILGDKPHYQARARQAASMAEDLGKIAALSPTPSDEVNRRTRAAAEEIERWIFSPPDSWPIKGEPTIRQVEAVIIKHFTTDVEGEDQNSVR